MSYRYSYEDPTRRKSGILGDFLISQFDLVCSLHGLIDFCF